MARGLLVLGLLLVLQAPAASAAEDFRIVLEPGRAPQITSIANVTVTVRDVEAGERLELEVAAPHGLVRGLVLSRGYFEVARSTQLVPRADGHYFVQLPGRLGAVESAAWLVNFSREEGALRMDLVFPIGEGNSSARLELARDVEPPAFELLGVTDLTHRSFLYTTRTDEHVFALLRIWPAQAVIPRPVPFPTPIPALEQRFPVQGLSPNTDYVFEIHFEDCLLYTSPSPRD